MAEEKPVRPADAATVEAVLAALDPTSADAELAPALSRTFPGFEFTTATVDDFYWRDDDRIVFAADGTSLCDHRAWVERELAEVGGDLTAFWNRHRSGAQKFVEWHGTSVFAFAPLAPASPTSSSSRSAARSNFWPDRSSIPITAPTAPTICSTHPG